MTLLLLDFPWELQSVLLPYSEAYAGLHDFERLCEEERLERVPFISEEEYANLMQQLPGRVNIRPVLQVLPHYLRDSFGPIRATPAAGPHDLTDNWKYALRDEMTDLDDWRTPQIIACEHRRGDWMPSMTGPADRTEVGISCEDQEQPVIRVIAFLGSYDAHRYAKSDRDAWDLRRTKPHNEERPCYLPKPPKLLDTTFLELETELEAVRQDGWCLGGRYYFIPPGDWKPEHWKSKNTKGAWRDHGSFRRDVAGDGIHRGPLDSEGRVWSWHEEERHWDVQLPEGGYWSISQTGRLLRKHE
jgi:hypothetical protein